ncbi:pituitary tumor-transforming gene 1 protein-interacting protein isoform X2 [Thalassophryne amazonica]|uniref:pituitary tumor-transforming gene 1 protein-interacting protein isoform X2 n=1 Tax=Thalassophryne amazonica TaxID=390379 RepID=UPI0014725151|nr:pituitary tumor-transforming gene 1 protein-interacting protein isoform X2 [Thalassophryne amazonica]
MLTLTTERQILPIFVFAAVVLVSFVSQAVCQTTPSPSPSACSVYSTCDTCVPHAECLWCFTTNNCTHYPVSWLLPPPSVCKWSQARWGVCWLNFEALVITLSVIGGTLLLSLIICCCCCCCCKKRRSRSDREEERYTRRRDEMRQRAEERKLERKAKNDEIRRKYGLMSDSDHPYSKFENE